MAKVYQINSLLNYLFHIIKRKCLHETAHGRTIALVVKILKEQNYQPGGDDSKGAGGPFSISQY